jgi:hypothetical protein
MSVINGTYLCFCYRSNWKSLDGAGLVKPKFTVAPTCDCPLFQQRKSFPVFKKIPHELTVYDSFL